MKCPACGKGLSIVECDTCGDIRCKSNGDCPGTKGGKKGFGQQGMKCKACGKGKYKSKLR